MLKVALVTNSHPLCGNADYGRDLKRELDKEFEVHVYEDAWQAQCCDIAVVNWHPARVQLPPEGVHKLHEHGMKVIVTLQNSFSGYYDAKERDPLRYADAVVCHQPMQGNVNFTHIPLGIRIIEDLPEPVPNLKIGIAGFPFAWKRFDLTASVAQVLGGSSLLIGAHHDMGDSDTPIRDAQRAFPQTTEVVREYLSSEDVIRRLATCTMNIFWYQHMPPDDLVGQSGSARMGVAARRPIILSDHPKLRTLVEYEDEIYLAMTQPEVYDMAKEIWEKIQRGEPVKRPKRILEERGWDKTGMMYRELIRTVAA